jgi:hypothetical protein
MSISIYYWPQVNLKKKYYGRSPRANYTDHRLSAKLVPTFFIEGGQRDGSLWPADKCLHSRLLHSELSLIVDNLEFADLWLREIT